MSNNATSSARRDGVGSDGVAGTSSMWWTVARREMSVKIRDRSLLVSLIIVLVIVAVSVGVSLITSGTSDDKPTSVAVTDDAGAAIVAQAQKMAQQTGERQILETVRTTSLEQGREVVTDEKAKLVLHHEDGTWHLESGDEPPSVTSGAGQLIAKAVEARATADLAQKAGVDPQQAVADGTVLPGTVDPGQADNWCDTVATFMGVGFAVVYMFTMMFFGNGIAASVVEEKQSRIVEILLACIPARQLLAGKIIGNTILAAGLMLILLVLGCVGVSFTPAADLLGTIAVPTAWFIVFFIVGFLSLACLWAATGALASRTEDLQSTSMPLVMIVMIAYVFGIQAVQNHGISAVVASYVPVASAIAMPTRVATGGAAWWEVVVSILISVLFSALTIWGGERIYRRSVLKTGGKVKLRVAWRSTDVVA